MGPFAGNQWDTTRLALSGTYRNKKTLKVLL